MTPTDSALARLREHLREPLGILGSSAVGIFMVVSTGAAFYGFFWGDDRFFASPWGMVAVPGYFVLTGLVLSALMLPWLLAKRLGIPKAIAELTARNLAEATQFFAVAVAAYEFFVWRDRSELWIVIVALAAGLFMLAEGLIRHIKATEAKLEKLTDDMFVLHNSLEIDIREHAKHD